MSDSDSKVQVRIVGTVDGSLAASAQAAKAEIGNLGTAAAVSAGKMEAQTAVTAGLVAGTRSLAAADALTAALDAADGDPELEPSLGSQDAMWDSHDQRDWSQGVTDDRETDVHDQPHDDDTDTEPSFGWGPGISQAARDWYPSGAVGLPGGGWTYLHVEAELDPSEREPSLGSAGAMDQTGWANGARDDRKDDAGDNLQQDVGDEAAL